MLVLALAGSVFGYVAANEAEVVVATTEVTTEVIVETPAEKEVVATEAN